MKFKIIFILFNIVVVFSFLIVTIMPFVMLGSEYSQIFFRESWYFFVIFIIAIGAIDTYFFMNWGLFSLLEEEKWDDLVIYLNTIIYEKKRIHLQQVKMLANTLLLQSDMKGISKLEGFIRKEKPGMLKKIVLPLCVPLLASGDSVKMEGFFGDFIEVKGTKNRDWVLFLYSFALLLNGRKEAASDTLSALCRKKITPVLHLLTIYSLDPIAEKGSDKYRCVENRKSMLLSKYTKQQMLLELDRINDNVIVLVLNNFTKEAIDWLYKE